MTKSECDNEIFEGPNPFALFSELVGTVNGVEFHEVIGVDASFSPINLRPPKKDRPADPDEIAMTIDTG